MISRLKRDDPELAAQVVAGDITPNAAAIKAGIRHQYVRIRADDIDLAVKRLLAHYPKQQLIDALTQRMTND